VGVEVVAAHPCEGGVPHGLRRPQGGAARHLGLAGGRRRTRRSDPRRVDEDDLDAVESGRGAPDLLQHGDHALPDLGGGGLQAKPFGCEHGPDFGVVVECLREGEVLDPDRKPDTAPHRPWRRGEAGPPREPAGVVTVVVGERECGEGADHLGHRQRPFDALAGGRDEVPVVEGVAQTKLDRVHAEGRGETIHLALIGEAHLDGSEPPHGPRRGVVGSNRGGVDAYRGAPVGARGEIGGVGEDGCTGRLVGAAVEHEPRLDADEVSVSIGLVPVPHLRGVSVDVGGKGLRSVVDHLHRPPGVQRQQAQMDLQSEVLAGAEGAADPGEMDPDLIGLEAEAGVDLFMVLVDPLGGNVEVDAPNAVGNGEPCLGSQHRLVDRAGLVGALDHDLAAQILGAVDDLHDSEGLTPVEGLLRIDERFQRLVLDPHRPSGEDRCGVVDGGDDRHRLAPEPGLAVGEHRLIADGLAAGALAGHVVDREDGVDAGHRQRRGRIDRHDPRLDMGATDGGSPQHVVGKGIAGELETALHLGDAVRSDR
jgi:hypothetical protein